MCAHVLLNEQQSITYTMHTHGACDLDWGRATMTRLNAREINDM